MGAGARPPSGQQIKLMLEAFLDAFERDELKELVLFDLNVKLDEIVADTNMRTTVFELIMWAKRQGRVADLINHAAAARSDNDLMVALATSAAGWGLEAPVVLPGGGTQAQAAPGGQSVSGFNTAGGPVNIFQVQGGLNVGGAPAAPAPQPSQPLKLALALTMAVVPTAVVNLLDREQYPLIQVDVTNPGTQARRLIVKTVVHGYSDPWESLVTVEPAGTGRVLHRPVFIPQKLPQVITDFPVQIGVEVRDADTNIVQLVDGKEVIMLAYNSAPLRVKDEATGQMRDMLPYLAAFVTENDPAIQQYLKAVASYHPDKDLKGYYAVGTSGVRSQARAVSEALKSESKLSYAPALVRTVAESSYQRVRLPRECLSVGLANCVEGALLFCSLLEAMGLQSAVVWSREHAIVGWRETGETTAPWRYLDTTKLDKGTFEKAMEWGDLFVEDNQGKPVDQFGHLDVRALRAQGIRSLV